jgi:hypothetical protein
MKEMSKAIAISDPIRDHAEIIITIVAVVAEIVDVAVVAAVVDLAGVAHA